MTRRRILVIDDDEVDRKTVCRALAQGEFDGDIVQVASADEARRSVADQMFDCILLDYQLPGVDGLDLLTELHGLLHEQTPIVMLTGEGNEMVAVDAMKHGAYDYLPKSMLTPASLLRVITQALERYRLQHELADARAKIERQALSDSLTGLGNRRLLMRDLDRAISSSNRSGTKFCLLMMDLNKFKAVNDRYGHEAGDAVLIEIGRRLVAMGRANDLFYRLGGDEFTAIIDAVDDSVVLTVAERISEAVAVPVQWRDEFMVVGISIGIAIHNRTECLKDELLRIADVAMYKAKHSGQSIITLTETA